MNHSVRIFTLLSLGPDFLVAVQRVVVAIRLHAAQSGPYCGEQLDEEKMIM